MIKKFIIQFYVVLPTLLGTANFIEGKKNTLAISIFSPAGKRWKNQSLEYYQYLSHFFPDTYQSPKHIILISHGYNYSGKKTARSVLLYYRELHALCKKHESCIVSFDYSNKRHCAQAQEVEDLQKVILQLRKTYPASHIHLLGFSAGASALINLAGTYGKFVEENTKSIIAIAPFARLQNCISHHVYAHFPQTLGSPIAIVGEYVFKYGIGYATFAGYSPLHPQPLDVCHFTPTHFPTLFIANTKDNRISHKDTFLLYETLKQRNTSAEFYEFTNTVPPRKNEHCYTLIHPETQQAIYQFYNRMWTSKKKQ